MITIQIKEKQYEIPTHWTEVTLRQYIQLTAYADKLNPARLLSIVTDIPYADICNLPCDEFSIKVMPQMDFVTEQFNPFSIHRKNEITINGVKVKTIKDAGQERFGQKLYMQQIVSNGIEKKVNHNELVAPVVANYYAPYLHPSGKWDDKHVKEIETYIYDMPVVEVYPEADFFLRGYIVFAKPKVKR
jgi:hypothetical protein